MGTRLNEVRSYVRDMGLPTGEGHELPSSDKRFVDGAHFRTEELPTTLSQYEKMFSLCDQHGYVVNRISDVRGVMYDSDEEVLGKLELARNHGCEVVMAPGGGESSFDPSQQAELHLITEGKVRGMDNVLYTLDSMLRASELGCRAFLMYDEGILLVALKMRAEGVLPLDTKFKISANVSVANPAAIKFWFDLMGPQDEINPIRDLTLPMMAAMRQVTDHPLDMHVFHRTNIARLMEAPEIVRVAAPVYLKNARSGPGIGVEEKTYQCFRLIETIRDRFPESKQSAPGAAGLSIPVEPKHEAHRAAA